MRIAVHQGRRPLPATFAQCLVPRAERPKPEELTDDEILYYANPLQKNHRLALASRRELLGFTYVSPWPRSEAPLRRMD
jgi:hypothetical protein